MKAFFGCLAPLAIFGALAWGVVWLLERRIDEKGAAVAGGVIAAGFLLIAVFAFIEIARRARELLLFRRGLSDEEPADGKRYAAIGPIEVTGRPLISPISRKPAVAYSYEISVGNRQWEGVALTSSRVQVGMQSVRLLALPTFDFPKARLEGKEAEQNAAAFCEEAEFKELEGTTVRQKLEAANAAYRDSDGVVRRDVGSGKPPSLKGAVMFEQVVQPGEEVCAIGTWSAADGGLVVNPRAWQSSIRLRKGRPEGAAGFFFSTFGRLVKAAIATGVVAIALLVLFTFIPLDDVEARHPEFVPSWMEVRLESLIDREVHPRIAAAGIAPLPDRTEVGVDVGRANGRIRAGGEEVAVTRAVATSAETGVRIELLDDVRPVGSLLVSTSGELLSGELLGLPIDVQAAAFRSLPTHQGKIAGRFNFYRQDLAARVRFHAELDL